MLVYLRALFILYNYFVKFIFIVNLIQSTYFWGQNVALNSKFNSKLFIFHLPIQLFAENAQTKLQRRPMLPYKF